MATHLRRFSYACHSVSAVLEPFRPARRSPSVSSPESKVTCMSTSPSSSVPCRSASSPPLLLSCTSAPGLNTFSFKQAWPILAAVCLCGPQSDVSKICLLSAISYHAIGMACCWVLC